MCVSAPCGCVCVCVWMCVDVCVCACVCVFIVTVHVQQAHNATCVCLYDRYICLHVYGNSTWHSTWYM